MYVYTCHLPGMEMEPRSDGETLKCSLNDFANVPMVISVHILRLRKLQGLPDLPLGHGLLFHCLLAGKVERAALQSIRLCAQSQRSECCLHPLFQFCSQAAGDQKPLPAAHLSTYTYQKANHVSHFITNKLFLLHFDFLLFSPYAMARRLFSLYQALQEFPVFLTCYVTKALLLGFGTLVCIAGVIHLLRTVTSRCRYSPITHIQITPLFALLS